MPATAPRRSGALIAVVLIADLGLAAAGAFMLMKGLKKPAPAPPHKAEATAPAPAPVAAAPAPPPPAGSATVDPPPKPEPVAARPKDSKHHVDKKSPQDPHAGVPDQSAEIDKLLNSSVGSFRACLQTAIQTQPIHGTIRIAFGIQPDGHTWNTQAVVNTTGSDQLASCLSATIATWTFAPHTGPVATYDREFNYP
jgi:hypothetical protein